MRRILSVAFMLIHLAVSSVSCLLFVCQHLDNDISHLELIGAECCGPTVNKAPHVHLNLSIENSDNCGACKDDPLSLAKSVAKDNEQKLILNEKPYINTACFGDHTYTRNIVTEPHSSVLQVFKHIPLRC